MCSRCVARCSNGVGLCKVVDVERGDLYSWRALYLSVLDVEDIPLFHIGVGSTASRIVVPGSPWACSSCWWADIVDPRVTVARPLDNSVIERIKFYSVDVVLVDGGEPLVNDWVLGLPDSIRRVLGGGSPNYFVVKTTGALLEDRLVEASKYYDGLLFEYTICVEKPLSIENVVSILDVSHRLFSIVEIHVPYDGTKKCNIIVRDLLEEYRDTAIHILPIDTEEKILGRAISLAKELRRKYYSNVYVLGDTSYSTLDTLCTSCGAINVDRKPWGTALLSRKDNGVIKCWKCGRELRNILIGHRERKRLVREIVIW